MDGLIWLKYVHVTTALVSGAGFAVRGVWMLRRSPRLQAPWVRVAPHVVDTLLLISGVTLAVGMGFSPVSQPWLASKLVLLVLYIGCGMAALRRGRSMRIRTAALLLALSCYALIVASAVAHRPLGMF